MGTKGSILNVYAPDFHSGRGLTDIEGIMQGLIWVARENFHGYG